MALAAIDHKPTSVRKTVLLYIIGSFCEDGIKEATQISPEESLSKLRSIKASPTYGGDDGTAEEGGRGQVPVAGEVLRKALHIQARFHCRHHSLQ